MVNWLGLGRLGLGPIRVSGLNYVKPFCSAEKP